MDNAACCSPHFARPGARDAARVAAKGLHPTPQSVIPPGTFLMGDHQGDGHPADGERPVHPVTLDGFSIDSTAVTNGAFRIFVEQTGYVTEAEVFGFSAVLDQAVRAPADRLLSRVPGAPWWVGVLGADWRHPGGPHSSIDGMDTHPVVHVSWNDALAYCEWSGRRLPTEAQWEYASRGGIEGARYPWGEQDVDDGGWRANIWQGSFPVWNTMDDGWLTTAPVGAFAANRWGLHETVGNVWEWCADWFDSDYYRRSPEFAPLGPEWGQTRVMRGGSYLCHPSYCNRYRNAARTSNTPDSSAGNLGFRTVAPPASDDDRNEAHQDE